jgi:hypothetical protein
MTEEKYSKSSSAFLITLNQIEYFYDLKQYFLSFKSLQYAIACQEKAPTTGHIHIHIFIQLVRSYRLSLSKLFGAHVDKCYGSAQQNIEYVRKDGNIIWEYGSPKKKGGVSIAAAKKLTKEERENLPLPFYNIVEKINREESCKVTSETFTKSVKVYFISGPSGIGKTQLARLLLEGYNFDVLKYENSFWIGASQDNIAALYDDWRDNQMKAQEFLNFVDYNRQLMNVKNGHKMNNYKIIAITSIQRLDEIYANEVYESKQQWLRRVKEIKLSVVYNDERKKKINILFDRIINYIKLYILKLFKNNK